MDDDDEKIEWVDIDKEEEKNDDDDDKSINLKKTDDEETGDKFMHSEEYVQDDDEETDDELVHGDKQVNDDEDEEMTEAEVVESKKGDEEIANTAKAYAEKTEKVKDDTKKAKFPPSSSCLSIQSPSTLTVFVLVIPEPLVLIPIPETPSVTPATTLVPPSFVYTISHVPLKTTTPIPTPPSPLKLHQSRKRDRDDEDPSAGPNQGKKNKRSRTKESKPSKKSSTSKESSKGKSPAKTSKSDKSVIAEELVKEPVFEMAFNNIERTVDDVANDADQPLDDLTQTKDKDPKKDWFKQPPRPPTPDPKWNKRQVVVDQPEHSWSNQMVSAAKDPLTFDELMATPTDFSKYAIIRLKIDNFTQAHLVGPVYELLKGTCTSSIELEYNMEECFKALANKLDWNNTDLRPFDLTKPLPLKGLPDRLTVSAEYFFNNNLEFLKSSDMEKKYTMSITKTKADRYEIVEIEDMVPTLWSATKVGYDKDALKGIKYWGDKHQLCVSVERLHGYGHLDEIMVNRVDRQLYKFKEDDFVDLHLNDIEDMLLFSVQHKLFHLNGNDIVDFIVALRMFIKSLIIKRRVEDLQLSVESYQKKLNITEPQKTFPRIEFKKLYTPSYKPPGVIYEDLNKQKRVIRADELYKFSKGTLNTVHDELYHIILNFFPGYNKEMNRRKWSAIDKRRSELMVELIDKQMRERRIIRNLKRLVGARELEMDYKLMIHTECSSSPISNIIL
uniref:Uncharacterized protein n=1 Tax=Tanacetum cinerariifolium TaxID=118510 RepID=A0A6L2JSF8_TANCI|nr:hypothetical protein [Tanacetum cinerariifolium]